LVPPEKVRETFDCKPTSCRRCGEGLRGDDPTPLIHQVAELPEVEPFVDEYRLHRLACPGCGETTCGALPPGVPRGGFGAVSAGRDGPVCRSLPAEQFDEIREKS
jgi:transposase